MKDATSLHANLQRFDSLIPRLDSKHRFHSLINPEQRALVAQGIEHRPPAPGAQVRFLPGARKLLVSFDQFKIVAAKFNLRPDLGTELTRPKL